jgi:outer membrane receptor protein involved in Fe transport
MKSRSVLERAASVAVLATLAFCCAPLVARAGTTGKLAGVVRDAKKQPLVGANVTIPEARVGAISDVDGRYALLNVPAGTYTVKVALIGYAPTTVQSVAIPADRTTALDVVLQEAALEMKEVVVTARRPVVELGLTSNVATITRDQIATLPVQELQDIVNLQAGVVDGHIRGGRKDEVQYQVDGVTVNNPFDNASSVRLDRSVLEEVQVISGTFDAEYGQAMSGVVNAVLKRGTQRLEWSGETFQGAYLYPGSRRGDVNVSNVILTRPQDYEFRPGNLQNYQLTFSGPTGFPNTLFLLSGRQGIKTGFIEGRRRFVVLDRSDPDTIVPRLVNAERVPIGYTREGLALGKISNRSIPGVEIAYSAILNKIHARPENWDFRYDVDGLSKQRTYSVVHGLEWTHTLNPRTFYRLSFRYNYFDYRDMLFDDVWDPRYDFEGPVNRIPGFEYDAILYGVDETRFVQRTKSYIFAGSFTRQIGKSQQAKAGIEWQPASLRFGHPGYLSWIPSAGAYQRHFDEPDNGYPAPVVFRPVIGSVYAQDDLEWNDLRLRAGLRFEYFNPKSMVPGDFANPANSIEGAAYVPARAASRKLTLSPRLGVSYPVTSKSSLFFAYGHFYQLPKLGDIFNNADYSVLKELQATGGRDFGTLGNPDIKPERTIQYQFGYKQELRDWLGLDLTIFYKDIRDLLGSRILITYNDASYKQLSNSDFGNVIGVTLALDQRAIGIVSSSLDYTWQVAKGNASDPYETAARADAGEDARPRQVPLNWDQRHTLNLTVTLSRPNDFNLSGVFRAASGQPYTPATEIVNLESNSGRKPSSLLIDVRAEKAIGGPALGIKAFGNVFNAFDTRFFNGVVFENSGSPFYSRTPSVDQKDLANPTRYYAPRRIELGIRWEAGLR